MQGLIPPTDGLVDTNAPMTGLDGGEGGMMRGEGKA